MKGICFLWVILFSFLLINSSNSNNPEAVVYTFKVKDYIKYKEDMA